MTWVYLSSSQDDDYLIRPEIIHTLHSRILHSKPAHIVHLLPPHEHLSSTLRETHIPGAKRLQSDIHTSFAWLGHGAMMHRSDSADFLSLLHLLNATDAEMKMADNYFTILGNRVPEIWLDQGIELGGGQPFTVGSEGHERNARHILQAAKYLQSMVECNEFTCSALGDDGALIRRKLPYVDIGAQSSLAPWVKAACRDVRCLLETNIVLLPVVIAQERDDISNILSRETSNLDALGEAGRIRYVNHPPSYAVDDRPETYFRSLNNAKNGDMIILDFMQNIHDDHRRSTVEMVWLVSEDTERILYTTLFASSPDGVTWCPSGHNLVCYPVTLGHPGTADAIVDSDHEDLERGALRECSINMVSATDALSACSGMRYFRTVLQEDVPHPWSVNEVWLRSAWSERDGSAS